MKLAIALLLVIGFTGCAPTTFHMMDTSSDIEDETGEVVPGPIPEPGKPRPVPTYPTPAPTATPAPTPMPTPTPIEDIDPEDPGVVTQPVDPLCAPQDTSTWYTAIFLPYVPLSNPTLPLACKSGFEMNNLRQDSISVFSTYGSYQRKLVIDIATYTAPDDIHIKAYDSAGNRISLVHTCRMRTATYADPTRGVVRPPEESIRRWEVTLPAGAKRFEIDNTGASTPTYVRVLGLCDFKTNVDHGLGTRYRPIQ